MDWNKFQWLLVLKSLLEWDHRRLYIRLQITMIPIDLSILLWLNTMLNKTFQLINNNFELCCLKQICDDSFDGNVSNRLPEEDRLQSFGGKLSQRRKSQEKSSEPDPIWGGNGRFRDAIFLKHQVRLVLQKLDLKRLTQSLHVWNVRKFCSSQLLPKLAITLFIVTA